MLCKRLTLTALIAITLDITGAAAMSSSTATSITIAPNTATQPQQKLTITIQHAEEKEASTLKHKPLASWTADDLITWFSHEAPTQNANIPMLQWFDGWLVQNDIRRIFKQHTNWYKNIDSLMNLLEKTHYFTCLIMNNYMIDEEGDSDVKEAELTIAMDIFTALHKFVSAPTKQPVSNDKPAAKEVKSAAPTYTSDEPTAEDDQEVNDILKRMAISEDEKTPRAVTP